jgi:hypothetical protein
LPRDDAGHTKVQPVLISEALELRFLRAESLDTAASCSTAGLLGCGVATCLGLPGWECVELPRVTAPGRIATTLSIAGPLLRTGLLQPATYRLCVGQPIEHGSSHRMSGRWLPRMLLRRKACARRQSTSHRAANRDVIFHCDPWTVPRLTPTKSVLSWRSFGATHRTAEYRIAEVIIRTLIIPHCRSHYSHSYHKAYLLIANQIRFYYQ